MHDIGRTQLELGETELGETELGEFGETELGELNGPLGETAELELATELLEVSNESELEQFLGNLISLASQGIGDFINSPVGQAIGDVLKDTASQALPALGTAVRQGLATWMGIGEPPARGRTGPRLPAPGKRGPYVPRPRPAGAPRRGPAGAPRRGPGAAPRGAAPRRGPAAAPRRGPAGEPRRAPSGRPRRELEVARAAQLFGLELEGLSHEDREFELAQQFVRFASTAAANAAGAGPLAGSPMAVARAAAAAAAAQHAPGLVPLLQARPGRRGARSGRWVRRGTAIVLIGT